jgi:hypothetical protein
MVWGRQPEEALHYFNITFQGLDSFFHISIKKSLSLFLKLFKHLFQILWTLKYSDVPFWKISRIFWWKHHPQYNNCCTFSNCKYLRNFISSLILVTYRGGILVETAFLPVEQELPLIRKPAGCSGLLATAARFMFIGTSLWCFIATSLQSSLFINSGILVAIQRNTNLCSQHMESCLGC